MLNQTFGEVAVSQLRPPNRLPNAGASLIDAIGGRIQSFQEGKKAAAAEANADAAVISTLEAERALEFDRLISDCLLYTSPSPRDRG